MGSGALVNGNLDVVDVSLLHRLRRETRSSHEDLERRVDILNRVRTAESYRTLLETFYGIYCPLESRLARSIPEIEIWLPDIAKRMRTASLCRDLHVLGNPSPEALPVADVPWPGSLAEQFGWLYVLEGSTLGGQVIAREVNGQLHYTADHGCSFFASHGAEIGSMWRKFREAIERYAVGHIEDQDRIIQSAVATFRAFGDWFEAKT